MASETCITCGIFFTVPDAWQEKRKADGVYFWCPNGHQQAYQDTTEARLKREKAALERRHLEAANGLQSKINEEKHLRLVAEKAFESERRKRRKIEKRIANGVCPCCNRTFEDLARHMAVKHKDYALPPAEQKRIEGTVQ